MALLLLLVLVTQAASRVELSVAGPELSAVPVPTNVKIEAYNLNTVVSWNYPDTPQTPVFTVQVKTYEEAKWIHACNTTHQNCNITSMITDPADNLWARVKARLGQEESAYAESKEFILCQHGKIGPPEVDIRHKDDQIIIDILHPLVSENGEELEAECYEEISCYTYIYNLYVRINGSLIKDRTCKPIKDGCYETHCQSSIPVSSLNSEYCISVEGVIENWLPRTEKSKELCLTIFDYKRIGDSVWIPLVAGSLFLVLTLVVVYCNIKKINPFKRRTIMLPKSLMSVVKNASSEVKSESKDISPIIYQPIIPEHEQVVWEEQLSSATISSAQTEIAGKVEHRDDFSSETEVGTTEEKTSDVTPGSPVTSVRRGDSVLSSSDQSEPSSVTLNSYHSRNGSDSGLMESEGFLSDSEFPPNNETKIKAGEPEPIMLRNTTTSFGYDKPHVFVELPVNEGKESLIGYRVTEGSKGFS
ncbi:interferon gamma receptor 1 [Saccopteryx bilineata]|uniref:interferon gamma receptor 1 n=1 Tax=Saccopteryx bilineata TaxID=59482 RepID=UPI00338E83A4